MLDGGVEENNEVDEDESKADRRERERLENLKDEGEEFSAYMKFRQIFYTPDGGLLIVSEQYHHFVYTTSTYTPGTSTSPGSTSQRSYSVYECGDVLLCKLDASSNVGWLKIIPKMQREVISGSSNQDYDYFYVADRPFYAGFGTMQTKDHVLLFLNDDKVNGTVTQAGQKVRKTQRFSRTDMTTISIDPMTGAITRKFVFSNSGNPTAMPRLGTIVNNEMYLVGKTDRALGKSKIAVGKLTVK